MFCDEKSTMSFLCVPFRGEATQPLRCDRQGDPGHRDGLYGGQVQDLLKNAALPADCPACLRLNASAQAGQDVYKRQQQAQDTPT